MITSQIAPFFLTFFREIDKSLFQFFLEEIMSEKHERFCHLAERRVNNALASIRSVGKLSNKSRYEYQDKDVKRIYSALKSEIDAMRDALEGRSEKKDSFKLH